MEILQLRQEGSISVAAIPLGSLRSGPSHRAVIEDLRTLAATAAPALVLNVQDVLLGDIGGLGMGLNSTDISYFLNLMETLRSGIRARGCHLLLVVPDEMLSLLKKFSKVPLFTNEAEAIAAAQELEATPPAELDPQTQAALTAIQGRFHDLVLQRVGHLMGSHELPSIVQHFAAGERRGGQPIRGGSFNWQLEGSGVELKLTYFDSICVASGFGRQYEITPTETRLIAEGLD